MHDWRTEQTIHLPIPVDPQRERERERFFAVEDTHGEGDNQRFPSPATATKRERERGPSSFPRWAMKRENCCIVLVRYGERRTTEREYRRFLAEPRRGSITFPRQTMERETIALLGDEDGAFWRETKQTEPLSSFLLSSRIHVSPKDGLHRPQIKDGFWDY